MLIREQVIFQFLNKYGYDRGTLNSNGAEKPKTFNNAEDEENISENIYKLVQMLNRMSSFFSLIYLIQ